MSIKIFMLINVKTIFKYSEKTSESLNAKRVLNLNVLGTMTG